MSHKKSDRNKTIDFSEEEGLAYIEKCFFPFAKNGENDNKRKLAPSEIENKIICADSFTVLPLLPEKLFPLIIADPPYNISKKYDSSYFTEKSMAEYESYTEKWLSLVLPLLKDDGTMYICVDWKSSIAVGKILSEYEKRGLLKIRNRITWEREKGRGAAANWKNCHEDIWFITKGNDYTFNTQDVKMRRKVIAPYRENGKPKDWQQEEGQKYRDTFPSNFWNDITIPFWSMAENTAHPTQKPEKLLAKLILASSNPGEIVFDPFGGSGSTAVTAKKLGRKWCLIEKEKRFCGWAQFRLEQAETDREIQGFENGIFMERNSI